MRVDVRLFAALRERAGHDRVTIELIGATPTVAQLVEALAAAYPALASLLPACRVAIDHTFVRADQAVDPRSEIAIIPPVSGGAPRYWVSTEPLDPRVVEARVTGPDVGAVVTFTGTVRDHTGPHGVRALDYEAYPEMALKVLEAIGAEIEARWPGCRVAIAHRFGHLVPGEASVVVAAAHAHRAAAFEACRHGIERLKQDAPIWKREAREDGSVWVGQGS